MRSFTPSVTHLLVVSLLGLGAACGVDSREVDRGSQEPPGGASSPAGAATATGGTAATLAMPGTGGAAATQPTATMEGMGGNIGLTGPTAPPPGSASGGEGQLDLLFVIDNSISMADKQDLLGQVANVLDRFVNPVCVDDAGNQFPSSAGACPAGQRRQFEPVTDVHLGVITTSLGDAGAEVACPRPGFPRYVPDRVDNAHLLGSLPRGSAPGVNPSGFISWRAGEDAQAAATSFAALVTTAGENGCGWEQPLEAWYRFLVDPQPYTELARVPCSDSNSTAANCVQPLTDASGAVLLDQVMLAQREAFLRPSSRLGIVMLTDENDCSIAIDSQNWVVAAIDDARPMFRGSSACDQNPNDPCCYSCPLGAPAGCAEDPVCQLTDAATGQLAGRLSAAQDGQNLRCFAHKRRFGVDFLYPVARYVNALTQPTLCASEADLAVGACAAPQPNPLFAGGRSPSDVFLAGILGVPYQLIEAQVDTPGRPRVAAGFRYKVANELSAADWNAMVGDSSASPPVAPTSAFMVESEVERAGIPAGNPINGREYSTLDTVNGTLGTPDDLEHACILPLPVPRDCALRDPATEACDCYQGTFDSALCEQEPGQSAAGTVQYWGKAYPGTRQLEVLRRLGPQAVVSSICARNTSAPAAADFAYLPAIAVLVDSMAPSLNR